MDNYLIPIRVQPGGWRLRMSCKHILGSMLGSTGVASGAPHLHQTRMDAPCGHWRSCMRVCGESLFFFLIQAELARICLNRLKRAEICVKNLQTQVAGRHSSSSLLLLLLCFALVFSSFNVCFYYHLESSTLFKFQLNSFFNWDHTLLDLEMTKKR